MTPRLTAKFWVHAYLNRLRMIDIPAFVVLKGDLTAGAVVVKMNTLDGQAMAYQRSFDLISGARKWIDFAVGGETGWGCGRGVGTRKGLGEIGDGDWGLGLGSGGPEGMR